jgi:putative photosynthetic complex assembly protein
VAALPTSRPAPVILIALALAAVTLAVAWRPGGPAANGDPPSFSRDLRFEDLPDGGVRVRDAADGEEITVLAPGSEAFIRGALRALVRDRRLGEQGGDYPFRISSWPDGRLRLQDTATGRTVALEAFGATNAGAFARLLTNTPGRP